MHRSKHFLGGLLLIAGTSIGGGMLALPVATSAAGFFPSLFMYLLSWAFMASTGVLFVELTYWQKKEGNILSMAEMTLGPIGKAIAWVLYLFLFYCLMVVYIGGCGNLLSTWSQEWISDEWGFVLFLLIFTPMIGIGARVISPCNTLFMVGLFLVFSLFLFYGSSYIELERLQRADWSSSLTILPIVFTAFAYQGAVPTLFNYMERDTKKAKWAIWGGSFLTLLVYIAWNLLILGSVPFEGKGGLQEAMATESHAIGPLQRAISNPWIFFIGNFLAFFALITSFFGVSLGLFDFLADGLKIKKNKRGRVLLSLLVVVPPFLITLTYPRIFITALIFAGGYGVALLLGLLPIIMVWSMRYKLKQKMTADALPGGRFLLLLMGAFVLFELGCQLYRTFVGG